MLTASKWVKKPDSERAPVFLCLPFTAGGYLIALGLPGLRHRPVFFRHYPTAFPVLFLIDSAQVESGVSRRIVMFTILGACASCFIIYRYYRRQVVIILICPPCVGVFILGVICGEAARDGVSRYYVQ